MGSAILFYPWKIRASTWKSEEKYILKRQWMNKWINNEADLFIWRVLLKSALYLNEEKRLTGNKWILYIPFYSIPWWTPFPPAHSSSSHQTQIPLTVFAQFVRDQNVEDFFILPVWQILSKTEIWNSKYVEEGKAQILVLIHDVVQNASSCTGLSEDDVPLHKLQDFLIIDQEWDSLYKYGGGWAEQWGVFNEQLCGAMENSYK